MFYIAKHMRRAVVHLTIYEMKGKTKRARRQDIYLHSQRPDSMNVISYICTPGYRVFQRTRTRMFAQNLPIARKKLDAVPLPAMESI